MNVEGLQTIIRFVGEQGHETNPISSSVPQTSDFLLFSFFVIACVAFFVCLSKFVLKKFNFANISKIAGGSFTNDNKSNKGLVAFTFVFALIAIISGYMIFGNQAKAYAESQNSLTPSVNAIVDDSGKITVDNAVLESTEGFDLAYVEASFCEGIKAISSMNLKASTKDIELYNGIVPGQKAFRDVLLKDSNIISFTISGIDAETAKSLIGKDVLTVKFNAKQPVPPTNFVLSCFNPGSGHFADTPEVKYIYQKQNSQYVFPEDPIAVDGYVFDYWKDTQTGKKINVGDIVEYGPEHGTIYIGAMYKKIDSHKLQINYLSDDGIVIENPYVDNLPEGKDYFVQSPEIWGYELINKEQKIISGVMGNNDINIDVVYKEDGVNYFNIYGVTENTSGKFDVKYDNQIPDTEDLSCLNVDVWCDTNMNYIFTEGSGINYEQSSYSVNGEELSYTLTDNEGNTNNVSFVPKHIAGFTPVWYLWDQPIEQGVSKNFSNRIFRFNLVYQENPLHNLTINYLSDDGIVIENPYVAKLPEGKDYFVQSPEIWGYELINKEQKIISGVMGDNDINIDVVYKEDGVNYFNIYGVSENTSGKFDVKYDNQIPDTEDLSCLNVDVWCDTNMNYIFTEGSGINYEQSSYSVNGEELSYTLTDNEGNTNNVSFVPKHIAGFTPVWYLWDQPIEQGVSKNFSNRIFRFNLVYIDNPSNILTINYVDDNGKKIVDSYVSWVREGDSYSVESPEIEGYVLQNPNQKVISGDMGKEDVFVSVVYVSTTSNENNNLLENPENNTSLSES